MTGVHDYMAWSGWAADPVVDWRAMYEWREEQYEAKLRASGERLKQMAAAESCGKDSRSIQVWPSCHISLLSCGGLHDCLTDLKKFLSSWHPPEACMFAIAL